MKTTNLASDVPGVLKIASGHMRKLASTNVELRAENTKLASELRVTKIARRMELRGIQPNLSFEEKVAGLSKFDEVKLASVEDAIELVSGGTPILGTVQPSESGVKTASYSGDSRDGQTDPLDAFVLSQAALG